MEDYKFNENIEFSENSKVINPVHYEQVIEITNKIKSNFKQTLLVNAELCGLLMELKDAYTGFVSNGTYKDYFEYVEFAFGLSYKTCMSYLAVGKKFVVLAGENYRFTTAFEKFNISKLQELCSVEDKQLLKDLETNKLNSSMTRKQIREYVKSLKPKQEDKKLEWPYTFVEDELNILVANFLEVFKKNGIDNSETEDNLQKLYDYWKDERKEYVSDFAHGALNLYDWLYLYCGLSVEEVNKHIKLEEVKEVEVEDTVAEKQEKLNSKYATDKYIDSYLEFYKTYSGQDIEQLKKLLLLNLKNIKNHFMKQKAEWETQKEELLKEIKELKGE